jgi:hypothetical protein
MVVHVLERAFPQAAAGYRRNGIGRAAVSLYEDDEPFRSLPRLLDAQFPAGAHRHTHAQHLAGAGVPAVHLLGRGQQFLEQPHPVLLNT